MKGVLTSGRQETFRSQRSTSHLPIESPYPFQAEKTKKQKRKKPHKYMYKNKQSKTKTKRKNKQTNNKTNLVISLPGKTCVACLLLFFKIFKVASDRKWTCRRFKTVLYDTVLHTSARCAKYQEAGLCGSREKCDRNYLVSKYAYVHNIQSRVKQEVHMPQIQKFVTRYSSPY